MKPDEPTPLREAYRFAARELPSAAMDQAILSQARRMALQRRSFRYATVSCGAIAACICAWMLTHGAADRSGQIVPSRDLTTAPAGYLEGQARSYLLDVAATAWPQSGTAHYLSTVAVTGAMSRAESMPSSASKELPQ
jgi:hypothetical protein